MGPLITVIIPTYNNEKTIQRCVDSVLKQTIRDIEIIIINDGSTDKTQEILEDLSKQDKRIRLIQLDHNVGQGIARNFGIMNARGEYIGFVDADDTISSNMYENMLQKAIEHDAEIVQCNIINVFPDGKYVFQLPELNKVVHVKNRKEYFDKYVFRPQHSFECCNKLIKKRFLLENNIKFQSNEKVFAEDLLFNFEMAAKLNTIVFMGEAYYHYYQYEDSHSKTQGMEKIEKLCVLFELFYRKEKELRFQCAQIAILILMLNLSRILKEGEATHQVKEMLRRRDIKKYLVLSFLSMKKIRHKILMLLLLCTPMKVKLLIIIFYYTRLK